MVAGSVPVLELAHGVGRVYESPLPVWLYGVGAAATVVISFLIRAAVRAEPTERTPVVLVGRQGCSRRDQHAGRVLRPARHLKARRDPGGPESSIGGRFSAAYVIFAFLGGPGSLVSGLARPRITTR